MKDVTTKYILKFLAVFIAVSCFSIIGLADSYDPLRRITCSKLLVQPVDNRMHTGKEFQNLNGLGWYDNSARQMDAILGRFTTPDPLAEKYYNISPYAHCANNPLKYTDPDGMKWKKVFDDSKGNESWEWTEMDYVDTGDKDKDGNPILRRTFDSVVVFQGSRDEKLGKDGTLTSSDASPANVTIYGAGGKDDIKTYDGLTVSSDPDKYSMVESGDYGLSWEQMATSPYGKGSLTYRVRQLNGNYRLPIEGGEMNKSTGTSYLEGIFFHRTNWNGKARNSSQGCLIIDGRQWRNVEKQLLKSNNMLLRLNR